MYIYIYIYIYYNNIFIVVGLVSWLSMSCTMLNNSNCQT